MNQVAEIENKAPVNVYEIVAQQKNRFAKVLSTDEIKWAKEQQFAIQALQANEALNNTAWNNQVSLQNAIINVASIGISLNPALKHAYLVPRQGVVCLDISYMGLLNLAMKSGAILWGQAKLVYENDHYVNTGVDTAPRHEQQTFGNKGNIVGVYCTVKLPNGDYLTEEMDMATIDKIRNASKAANGPWKTWPEEMMRKAVVKRGSKYWPQSERVSEAVSMLNQQDGNAEPIVTAPELSDFTPDQKKYFDQLIEKSDALEMYVLLSSVDEGTRNNLYHSFEKGSKGKYQQVVDNLYSSGSDIFNDCIESMNNGASSNDDLAVREVSESLSTGALVLMRGKLTPEAIAIIEAS